MGQKGEDTQVSRLIAAGLRHVVVLLISWMERRGQRQEVTDDELLYELAKALSDSEMAQLVARKAGLPAHLVPVFKVSLTFWEAVLNAARSGMIEGGIMAVVKAAADYLPGNLVLARYLSSRR